MTIGKETNKHYYQRYLLHTHTHTHTHIHMYTHTYLMLVLVLVCFLFLFWLQTGGIAYLLQSGAQICDINFILGALSTLGALLDDIVQGGLEPVGFPMSFYSKEKKQQQLHTHNHIHIHIYIHTHIHTYTHITQIHTHTP